MTTLSPIDNPTASWHCNDCGSPFLVRTHVGGLRGGLPRRQTRLPFACSNPECVRSDPNRLVMGCAVPDQT